MLLGTFAEILRISWEHIGNMMGTRKGMLKIPPHPPSVSKREKLDPSLPLMNPS